MEIEMEMVVTLKSMGTLHNSVQHCIAYSISITVNFSLLNIESAQLLIY